MADQAARERHADRVEGLRAAHTQREDFLRGQHLDREAARENMIDRRRFGVLSTLGGNPGAALGGLGAASGGYSAAANRAAQARSQRQAGYGQLLGTGLTAGALLLSDRRLKTDIRKLTTLENGVEIVLFRWKHANTMNVGVIAQQVKEVIPAAVREGPGGMLMVDYSQITRFLPTEEAA